MAASGPDSGNAGNHVQTEALDDIDRIEVDLEELDVTFECDATLSGVVQLVTSGGDRPPVLRREGMALVVHQRGRHRPIHRLPALVRLPASGCPPLSGNHAKGDLIFRNVDALIMLKHQSGDIAVDGGAGPLMLQTGKGDAWYARHSGPITHTAGAGDLHLDHCAGPVSVSLGKGDVHASACDGALEVKSGAGDVHANSCGGDLLIKCGSGDVLITRPREQRVSVQNGRGDVTIEDGALLGMAIRTAQGDVDCTAQLLLPGHDDDDANEYITFAPGMDASGQSLDQFITRAVQDAMSGVRSKEAIARAIEDALSRSSARDLLTRLGDFEFEAGDHGVRIMRGGQPLLEASDQGVRLARGSFMFEASEQGVRVKRGGTPGETGVRSGEFDIETHSGDIAVQAPLGAPIRVEVLINNGDVRSDIPLVSVGRPGPRGAIQRLVGGTNPGDAERINLRLRAERGDVRLRAVRNAPPPPRARRAPMPPAAPAAPDAPDAPDAPTQPIAMPAPSNEREERMQTILSALASGSLSVAEAERLLEALDQKE